MSNPVRLSKAVSLALHAAVLLASDEASPLSTKGIAGALGVSEAHLAKVLQRLATGGIVRSIAGPAGGFVLAKPGDQIALVEVYETIEGPLSPFKCVFGTPVCAGTGCIFGGELQGVDAKLRRWLTGTKLSQLRQVLGERKGLRREEGSCSIGAKRLQPLSKSLGR
jgi:Rrf2 family protein